MIIKNITYPYIEEKKTAKFIRIILQKWKTYIKQKSVKHMSNNLKTKISNQKLIER